ncbi:MAG: metal-dependent hydrolase [Acidimicrobiales bacterium]
MLGRDHALLGGVGYLVAAPLVFSHLTPEELGVGCLTSAAFALLPDIDEPGSSVSRKLGPISKSVSEVTNRVAGGHRQGTHSLLFIALVGIGAWFAYQHRLALTIIVALSSLFVFRMLLPKVIKYARMAGVAMLAVTALTAWWVWNVHVTGDGWFILAAAGGCMWHLVGDTLTVEGVPYLWLPGVRKLQHIRLSVPLVGHCGSARETLVGCVLSLVLIWMAATLVVVPISHSVNWASLAHVPHIQLPGLPHVHVPKIPKSVTVP